MVEEKSPVPLTKFLPFSSKSTFLLSAFWYWRWAWNPTFLLCQKTCYIHPIGSAGENREPSRGRRDLHFPGFFLRALRASWLPPDSEYHPSNSFFFNPNKGSSFPQRILNPDFSFSKTCKTSFIKCCSSEALGSASWCSLF